METIVKKYKNCNVKSPFFLNILSRQNKTVKKEFKQNIPKAKEQKVR